jgi:hypothetical protein
VYPDYCLEFGRAKSSQQTLVLCKPPSDPTAVLTGTETEVKMNNKNQNQTVNSFLEILHSGRERKIRISDNISRNIVAILTLDNLDLPNHLGKTQYSWMDCFFLRHFPICVLQRCPC